ncbi:MAG: hypothetical protein JKP98_08130 [Rhodobacteraceae bacterium]|nr:hypothetical protein [Paracoccaceae bacterium]
MWVTTSQAGGQRHADRRGRNDTLRGGAGNDFVQGGRATTRSGGTMPTGPGSKAGHRISAGPGMTRCRSKRGRGSGHRTSTTTGSRRLWAQSIATR